jgi:anti-anti-sigma regulatory factor
MGRLLAKTLRRPWEQTPQAVVLCVDGNLDEFSGTVMIELVAKMIDLGHVSFLFDLHGVKAVNAEGVRAFAAIVRQVGECAGAVGISASNAVVKSAFQSVELQNVFSSEEPEAVDSDKVVSIGLARNRALKMLNPS